MWLPSFSLVGCMSSCLSNAAGTGIELTGYSEHDSVVSSKLSSSSPSNSSLIDIWNCTLQNVLRCKKYYQYLIEHSCKKKHWSFWKLSLMLMCLFNNFMSVMTNALGLFKLWFIPATNKFLSNVDEVLCSWKQGCVKYGPYYLVYINSPAFLCISQPLVIWL